MGSDKGTDGQRVRGERRNEGRGGKSCEKAEVRKCWIALKDGWYHLVEIDGSYQLLELQRHHSEPTRTRPWPTRAAVILPAPSCVAAPAYLELLRVASLL